MPSFVDAADAAGAAQGSSALVVATGAAVAACASGNDDSSIVVAAAHAIVRFLCVLTRKFDFFEFFFASLFHLGF